MTDLKYNSLVEFPTRILHIVAHPDDEAIYGGGIIALNQAVGGHSHVICMGGAEAYNSRRAAEFERSCEHLGVSGDLFGFIEGNYDSSGGVERTADLIRKHKPNFLLTHSPNDFHADHHSTREIAKQAAMYESSRTAGHQVDAILYTEGYTPHMLSEVHGLVNIGPVVDKVLSSLNVHNSQGGVSHYEQVMSARWKLRGSHAGCEQAEAYFLEPVPVSTRLRVPDYSAMVRDQSTN